jgi:hypothetical protein
MTFSTWRRFMDTWRFWRRCGSAVINAGAVQADVNVELVCPEAAVNALLVTYSEVSESEGAAA